MQPMRNPQKHVVVGQFILGSQQSVFERCSRINADNDAHRLVRVSHHGVNENLRLPGAIGDGLEMDQKHIIQMHKPLADFPLFGGGVVDSVRSLLRFNHEEPRRTISTNKLMTIKSKYCLSFLATWYASPPRVIGSCSLFQDVVEIFYHSQYMTTQPGQASLPGMNC